MNVTNVATVFLDRELEVVGYTPSAVTLFDLVPGDVGRPLADLKHRLDYPQLKEDARQVLAQLATVEREVGKVDDGWFLVRLQPYRTAGDHIAGVVLTLVDITARRQAEVALRQSEDLRRIALEGGRMGTWRWDLRDRLVWGDPEFLALWGVAPSEDPYPVSVFLSRMSAEGAAATEAVMTKDIAPGEEFDGQLQIVVGTGAGRWVRWRGRAERATPWIVNGVSFDVTEQRRADERVRASEEQFRSFVAATSDTVYKMGADWSEMRYLEGKRFLADTRGPSRSWLEEYIPPEDQPRVLAAVQEAVRDQRPFELEHRVIRADGAVGWVFSRAVPLPDARGGVGEWIGAARDVTERRRAEEALRASEARLQRMVNVPRVGVLTFDYAGQMLHANDAFLEMVGYTRADFEAKVHTWRDFTPSEYVEASEAVMAQLRQTGRGGPYEKEYFRRDGSRVWLMFVAADLGDGTIIEYAVDVTDRRRAEAALRASEARVAADLAGMRRLYGLHARLARETDLRAALEEIVAAACEFTGAERGCVQLVSAGGRRLEMIAWRGYGEDSPFIEHCRHEGSKAACDQARGCGERLLIEDVETFPPLQGTRDREIALAENIRATQSTPLVSRGGELVGVLSTQFAQRHHRPAEDALRLVDLLAWTAVEFVERHRALEALRASEAQKAFLLRLSDTLRSLADPVQIQAEAARVLGEQLGADRTFYAEVDAEGGVVVSVDHRSPGTPSIVGHHHFDAFGLTAANTPLRVGRTLVHPEVAAVEALAPAERAACARLGIAAQVQVPLTKEGRLAALLGVHHGTPRAWRPDEVALVEATAERTWAAVGRARTEATLRASLDEREALLKELHHRVKNNLQVITSLLEMQARQVHDPQAHASLAEARHRVTSIAAIHGLLYQSGSFSRVEFADYARRLVSHLVSFYQAERRIQTAVVGENVWVDLDRAVPCGLLLNELVSNVCKHAFPPNFEGGELTVTLRQDQAATRLHVSDNGVGLPAGFDHRKSATLGLQLVHLLARQLGGSVTFRAGRDGMRAELCVPRQPEERDA